MPQKWQICGLYDKGYQQLAVRTNQYLEINAEDVREGEIVSINRLNGKIKFKWNQTPQRDELPIIGYVAYFKLVNGFSRRSNQSILKEISSEYSVDAEAESPILWPPPDEKN